MELLEKLKNIAQRFEQIQQKLSDPDVITDQEQFKTLMKEHKTLEPINEKYLEYQKTYDTVPVSYTHLALPTTSRG